MIIETKICSKCKNELTLDNFRKGTGKYKKKNYCIPCDDKHNKGLYQKNRELRIEQVTEWNSAEDNEEKVKQYKSKWAAKNK